MSRAVSTLASRRLPLRLIASPWVLGYTALLGNTRTLPATASHLAVWLAIVILALREFNIWERATSSARGKKP